MGIRALEGYLLWRHRAICCPTVNVAQLADEYRRQTGRAEAEALVDCSVLTYLLASGLDMHLGGQFKVLKERVLAFAAGLRDLGVLPVFYFKGLPNEGQLGVWLWRKEGRLDDLAAMYERLSLAEPAPPHQPVQPVQPVQPAQPAAPPAEASRGGRGGRGGGWGHQQGIWHRGRGGRGRGGSGGGRPPAAPTPMRDKKVLMPSGAYECVKLALRNAGFKVVVSIDEVDLEMARVARAGGCFCILSTDTDFVALEAGFAHYLSLGHLLDAAAGPAVRAETVRFDRDAIARALGLRHRSELPLLLALVPNGCVPAALLTPLHMRVLREPLSELGAARRFRLEEVLPALARLVAELDGRPAEDAIDTIVARALDAYPAAALDDFARESAGLADGAELRATLRAQLEASLRSHDYAPLNGRPLPALPHRPPTTAVASQVLTAARSRHASLRFLSPSTLVLLSRGVLEQGVSLEDPALPAAAHCVNALRPCRARLYGLLLGGHGPAAPPAVREFIAPCSLPAGGSLEPVDVQPCVPGAGVWPPPRDLLELWYDGEDPAAASARWRLLAWALCPNESPALASRLRELPLRLALPAGALFLMVHSGALDAALLAANERAANVNERAANEQIANKRAANEQAANEQAANVNEWAANEQAANERAANEQVANEQAANEQAAKEQVANEEAVAGMPRTAEDAARLLARTFALSGSLTAAEATALGARRPQQLPRLAVHMAAQFLRAWLHLVMLNDALGAPVPLDLMQPADMFDGNIVHSVFADVSLPIMNAREEAIVEAVVAAACSGMDSCPDCHQDDGAGSASQASAAFAKGA